MIDNNFIAHTKNENLRPNSEIFFLGLSHKFSKSGDVLEAFCDSTNSGKIIHQVASKCPDKTIFKTNLVKGAPICQKGKLRYPNESEKNMGLSRLQRELTIFKPKIVYLFGKQVSDFVIKNLEIKKITDTTYQYLNTTFVLTEHPSYIAVYRRKYIDEYINGIVNTVYRVA